MINLIDQGTSPIFQAQNDLAALAGPVEIGEESPKASEIAPVPPKKPIPRRIQGHTFAFTGRIPGWPREARLYRAIADMDGRIVARAEHIDQAHCLVQGILQGDREETHKLRGARQKGIGIIGMEQFLKMLEQSSARSAARETAKARNRGHR